MKDASKLKDAYVANIRESLGAEAMAQNAAAANANLAGKLGMQVGGPQASIHYDIPLGEKIMVNDGRAVIGIDTQDGRRLKADVPSAGLGITMPVKGAFGIGRAEPHSVKRVPMTAKEMTNTQRYVERGRIPLDNAPLVKNYGLYY